MFKVIRINRKIVNVYNSQEIRQFTDFVNDLVEMESEEELIKLFTQKRYIWNYIRHKDFYKLMSSWFNFIEVFEEKHFLILKLVLETANNDITRTTFMNSINKKRAILTIDSVKYSEINKILESDIVIVCDEIIRPFIIKIENLDRLINAITISV